jgi:glycosyltransferase involved in cell wall biosynthesis
MIHTNKMSTRVSVVIPNYNGGATIGTCLQALFSSPYPPFEVIVVDDRSTDNSVKIIEQFPGRLVRFEQHKGASKARNTGAANSTGQVLFFIDADCVVQEETLLHVADAYEKHRNSVVGGSYTLVAFDDTFFSTFQSVFVHYSELKNPEPDYVASHAMVMSRELFQKSGGFPEDFMPILEDVEFSHRLKRSGVKLVMDDRILVRHIFNYDLEKSFRNAFRKSKYWTVYSLTNRDLLADSGTASVELKFTLFAACLSWILLIGFIVSFDPFYIACLILLNIMTLVISRGLIRAFFRAKGCSFVIRAALYYSLLYPLAVAAGVAVGALLYLQSRRRWS